MGENLEAEDLPKMKKRYMSVEEAEKIIPELEPKLKELIQIEKTIEVLRSIKFENEDFFEETMRGTKENREFHRLMHRFYTVLEEIHSRGAFLKGLRSGLVDFLSVKDGQEIFLCWKLGEKRISYWHTLHGGFSGRRHISELGDQKV